MHYYLSIPIGHNPQPDNTHKTFKKHNKIILYNEFSDDLLYMDRNQADNQTDKSLEQQFTHDNVKNFMQ